MGSVDYLENALDSGVPQEVSIMLETIVGDM